MNLRVVSGDFRGFRGLRRPSGKLLWSTKEFWSVSGGFKGVPGSFGGLHRISGELKERLRSFRKRCVKGIFVGLKRSRGFQKRFRGVSWGSEAFQ